MRAEPIVDLRVRPPYRGFLGLRHLSRAKIEQFARQLHVEAAPSALQQSMPLFLRELDAAGIDLAVVVGRQAGGPYGWVANDDIARLVAEEPGRFVGVAAVDLADPAGAVAEAERAVLELGLRGVSIDPGFTSEPLYPDEPRLDPLYACCLRLDVPVFITASVWAGPDLSYADPVHIDRVAARFPDLRIVVGHGAWPWVHQVLGVAFRRPNVYVSPDMYLTGLPGAEEYARAANLYLGERFLFASCYPSVPLQAAVEAFQRLPLHDDVRRAAMSANACRLLRLTDRSTPSSALAMPAGQSSED